LLSSSHFTFHISGLDLAIFLEHACLPQAGMDTDFMGEIGVDVQPEAALWPLVVIPFSICFVFFGSLYVCPRNSARIAGSWLFMGS
jgi:hypothetical protein